MQRKILEAATEEFADHGYGGARVERISRRARTVDRMLYYYFGSKEKLFRTVLEGAYEKLGQAEEQLHLADTPPLEGMRQLIAFTWDYYYLHPEFIRLLNTENQHRGQHLKKSSRVSQLSFPLLSTLRDLLERGAKEGIFRTEHRPGADLCNHRGAGLLLPVQPLYAVALLGPGSDGRRAPACMAGPHERCRARVYRGEIVGEQKDFARRAWLTGGRGHMSVRPQPSP